MRVQLLGTGSADGWPNPFCNCASCESERSAGRARTSSSALVDGVLMLDCGPTATHTAARAGTRLSAVEHVLITHGHPDHLAPEFLLWREWIAELPMLHVWAPAAAIERCRHWVGPSSPVTFHAVQPGQELDAVTRSGTYRVRVLAAAHGHGNGDELADEAVLYDITSPDASTLFYATDTGPLDDDQIEWVRDRAFDLVLVDESFGNLTDHGTGHLDLTTLPQLLSRLRGVGAVTEQTDVIAIHLSHHNPPTPQLAQTLRPLGVRVVDDLTTVDTHLGIPPVHHLILGGVRSGKSTHAEALAAGHGSVTYVATGASRPDDVEWAARVAAHRQRRPGTWQTLESADLISIITEARPGDTLLIDCIGMWLTRQLDDADAWSQDAVIAEAAEIVVSNRIAELAALVTASSANLIIVTNEVGQGVVPATTSGRLFRDLMGITNTALSRACNHVTFMVAGRPLPMGTLE
jgi:adenosylcobinamide kinase/adenosylcobinamide-phosphate guanylyltransferase